MKTCNFDFEKKSNKEIKKNFIIYLTKLLEYKNGFIFQTNNPSYN
jgi:hypothetical protein